MPGRIKSIGILIFCYVALGVVFYLFAVWGWSNIYTSGVIGGIWGAIMMKAQDNVFNQPSKSRTDSIKN